VACTGTPLVEELQESSVLTPPPSLGFFPIRTMEMLKLLTQKFRQQSLNEVQPFQPAEVEDRDSGTESDEENAELQAIEEAMQGDQEDQENHHQGQQLQHGVVIIATSPFQSPPRSSSSPVSSMSKRPFSQLVNTTNTSPFQTLGQHADLNSPHLINGHYSPQGSSDFERCSLDYEPTSSAEFDRHSSEEELSIINYNFNNREIHSEKRKWSQANHCGSCNESSGSSDDEVRELLSSPLIMKPIVMKPLNFSSSPPRGVQKLSRTLSPKLFLAHVAPMGRVCSVSPRKRHRQSSSTDVSDATVIQRPCLDFEKMQVSVSCY